ncbi:hypothetical protein PILCRDRAFT_14003 [Piloderma croceum F 1598]|uniref:Uncharacterized protein n=1 Tax=Piloderma croceum (strain F 1598) TaxID=765440 RepID=A0A0C3F4F7_PILCF|nr:hypothetical protein PILCRDRAFT_14003 [Piloderma croceum F 1598]
MSLILSDIVPDDLGPSWASADLVADIDPMPPYYGDIPSFDVPFFPGVSPPSRHIPYSPSDPTSYAPPYPIAPSEPVTSIICYSCHVCLDQFCVEFTSGLVHINSLVQSEDWDGPMLVLCWVAVNPLEIVGECEGRDFEGRRIVHFLVFMHLCVHRPEDLMLVEGVWRLRQYPAAPDSSVFLARAHPVEELSPPGPLFDIPISNLPSLSLSPSPSPNSWIRSIPTILVAFLSHCSLV